MKKDNFIFIIALIIFFFSIYSFFKVFDRLENEILTGRATDSSMINITISPVALINFTISSVDWGAGAIESNSSYAIIDTRGNITNGTWDPVSSGFVIANIGNVNLSLSFSSLHNADTFLGGTAPSYMYMISNNQDGSCLPSFGFDLNEYHEFPIAGNIIPICYILRPNRSITFDIKLKIPDNSLLGNLSDTITVSFQQSFD
jgi:hypothetical protein